MGRNALVLEVLKMANNYAANGIPWFEASVRAIKGRKLKRDEIIHIASYVKYFHYRG